MIQHPMQPPPELFGEWLAEACRRWPGGRPGDIAGVVARAAYAAGADAELEACVKWLQSKVSDDCFPGDLRAARRPKPPSLKQQSLALIDVIQDSKKPWQLSDLDVIRRALDALPDD